MSVGIVPSVLVASTLSGEWRKPGILWFIVSMLSGGVWALLFTLMTVISSPEITRALGNFFWPTVTTAAVSLFCLAYEFVFKETVSRRLAGLLFAPVVGLFVLSWINPGNIVFGPDYYVDAQGFLRFSPVSDPLRVLVVQVYGYLLVFLAGGLLVGGILRSHGIERQQTSYLLVVFSVLVASSLIKVGELVPVYYDPTSTVYAFSGLLFTYSIKRHGLLQYCPVARESAFEEIEDIILVVDANDVVVDTNRAGRELFDTELYNKPISELDLEYATDPDGGKTDPVQLEYNGEQRFVSVQCSTIGYGRGGTGKILILNDITELTERERELNLLKEIFSRVFRHNIRNDLTVITGYADLITDVQHDPEQVDDLTAGIHDKSTHLLNQAEKVRQIETVISTDRTVTGSLQQAIDDAIATYGRPEAVEIDSAVEDVTVEFHPQFHLALVELIENAVEHNSCPEPPTVDLTTESTEASVRLSITDTSGGIKSAEIEVLEAEQETDLDHGSGIGLWLVRYIVKRSGGTLSASTTESGTRITIELEKAAEETHR
jgi:signal transduction histidine kinase